MSRQLSLAAAPVAAPVSGIRELENAALQVANAIRLEVGQPSFPTPYHIVAAAKRALDEGWTFYAPTQGLRSFRERLAAKIRRVNGYRTDPDHIATAPGGVGAIAAAFAAIVEPGDEVLLPDPGWPNYELMVAWTHGRSVRYPCPPDLGFMPDLDRLAGLISPRSKLLVLNTPNNPTGAVYSRKVVEAMAELAERHNLWLLSDECYDQILFEGEIVSPATLLHDGRVVSAYSFSKTYAMTGWRLGYLVGSTSLVETATKIIESQSSGAPTISQKAGEAALSGPQDCVRAMVSAYRARRDLVVDLLSQARLLVSVPRGSLYVMADVSSCSVCARDFAFRLLKHSSVSVAPGTAFGDITRRAVRISLASSEDDLREGVSRLCRFVWSGASGDQ